MQRIGGGSPTGLVGGVEPVLARRAHERPAFEDRHDGFGRRGPRLAPGGHEHRDGVVGKRVAVPDGRRAVPAFVPLHVRRRGGGDAPPRGGLHVERRGERDGVGKPGVPSAPPTESTGSVGADSRSRFTKVTEFRPGSARITMSGETAAAATATVSNAGFPGL